LFKQKFKTFTVITDPWLKVMLVRLSAPTVICTSPTWETMLFSRGCSLIVITENGVMLASGRDLRTQTNKQTICKQAESK